MNNQRDPKDEEKRNGKPRTHWNHMQNLERPPTPPPIFVGKDFSRKTGQTFVDILLFYKDKRE